MNNLTTIFSEKILDLAGYAAVGADGNISAFDPTDLGWVVETASKKGAFRIVRVCPDVTRAWEAGNFRFPIEVHPGLICFAGGSVAAAIRIGRSEALERAMNIVPGGGHS